MSLAQLGCRGQDIAGGTELVEYVNTVIRAHFYKKPG